MLDCAKTMILLALIVLACIDATMSTFCNDVDVRLTQTLVNQGFHRVLKYQVGFNFHNNADFWLRSNCSIALEQGLPAGLFANPDEINELKRNKGLNAVVSGKVNVEAMAESSRDGLVYVAAALPDVHRLWLPLHARYHQPLPHGGFQTNEIGPPNLYVRCSDRQMESCNSQADLNAPQLCDRPPTSKCHWQRLTYNMLNEPLRWHIPVGNMQHRVPVALATVVVAFLGALYVIRAIHAFHRTKKPKEKPRDPLVAHLMNRHFQRHNYGSLPDY